MFLPGMFCFLLLLLLFFFFRFFLRQNASERVSLSGHSQSKWCQLHCCQGVGKKVGVKVEGYGRNSVLTFVDSFHPQELSYPYPQELSPTCEDVRGQNFSTSTWESRHLRLHNIAHPSRCFFKKVLCSFTRFHHAEHLDAHVCTSSETNRSYRCRTDTAGSEVGTRRAAGLPTGAQLRALRRP